MTTVGYGDITPKTPEGKLIAVTVMLVGIGFAALVVGAFADRFINPPVQELELTEEDVLAEVRAMSAQLQRIERALAKRSAAERAEPPDPLRAIQVASPGATRAGSARAPSLQVSTP
jgi:voltage-gated potassium channel